MRKKFGGYTINCSKARLTKTDKNWRGTQNYEVKVELWGTIEIGIDIDPGTWREDWLLKHAFKDAYTNYHITKLDQNKFFDDYVEHNQITAIVEAYR